MREKSNTGLVEDILGSLANRDVIKEPLSITAIHKNTEKTIMLNYRALLRNFF